MTSAAPAAPAAASAREPGVFRLYVTGWRYWADPAPLREAMTTAASLAAVRKPGARLVVVHGQCDPRRLIPRPARSRQPRYTTIPWRGALTMSAEQQRKLVGADWLAHLAAAELGWDEDPHPADWDAPCRPSCRPGHRQYQGGWSYCPAAGNYRNTEMAELRCDLGAAFIGPGSVGTVHAAAEMCRYNTPVRRYTL